MKKIHQLLTVIMMICCTVSPLIAQVGFPEHLTKNSSTEEKKNLQKNIKRSTRDVKGKKEITSKHFKKDGTPDMRYKENKRTTDFRRHKKEDTSTMYHKENKKME